MKKIITFIMLALLPLLASAYDALIDGIYYNFSGDEAIVTSGSPKYSGAVVIPASVTYNSKTYSVTSIDYAAFYKCGLISITIPNTVTSIGEQAFYKCSGLTSVTFGNSVTSIGDCAFAETAWYNNQPNGLVYAGKVAYKYKGSMPAGTQITIEDGTLGIAERAFWGYGNLTYITLPNSVTHIGYGAFYGCSGLTSITFGNSVTSIVSSAFQDCSSLTSITIPNSVTSIGNHAFSSCTSLTSITIPNSVTSIDFGAFGGCASLKSVTIGSGVTSIGEVAFGSCTSLTSVMVHIETPLSITANTFSNRANATLYVPYGSKSAYEAADYWNEFKEIVEEPDVITIGSTGFATYCSSYPLDFSEVSGMKAYIASGFSPSTGKLVLTRVTEVPAGEGLYLVGEAGTYEVAIAETDMMYSNLLKGVTSATTINPTDGSYTNFILANGAHGVAFYSLSEAGQLAAGKAYLQLPTASVSEVKAINVIFDDDATGISLTPTLSRGEGAIYNLQGQRVREAKNGLYIINGKKVFIK